MFHHTGHFLTNLPVQFQVNVFRLDDYPFKYGKTFHYPAVIPFPFLALHRFFCDGLHRCFTRFFQFSRIIRKKVTEQVRLAGIKRREFL